MPLWLEHLLALLLVGACMVSIVRQSFRALGGRGTTKIGNCCSKGCDPKSTSANPADRVVFLPVEMLTRR